MESYCASETPFCLHKQYNFTTLLEDPAFWIPHCFIPGYHNVENIHKLKLGFYSWNYACVKLGVTDSILVNFIDEIGTNERSLLFYVRCKMKVVLRAWQTKFKVFEDLKIFAVSGISFCTLEPIRKGGNYEKFRKPHVSGKSIYGVLFSWV